MTVTYMKMHPTRYHNKHACIKCGHANKVVITDSEGGHISECRTTCIGCSHEDYWAHGWFESKCEPPDE